MHYAIRPFEHRDVPQLLDLMRQLARFEGYIDRFRVTEADLVERGLGEMPQFEALVAARADLNQLIGMAVLLIVPFTYDLRPTLVLKELFVSQEARGAGVGAALFDSVESRARTLRCGRINWTVMSGNSGAEAFYRRQGARPDSKWHGWVLDLADSG